MRRWSRAFGIAILSALSCSESAHCQPLSSYYGIDLDDRFTLVHSSKDAFWVVDGTHEVLMIDPVWDNMKLDAYCKLPKALLVRAYGLTEKGQRLDTGTIFFVIHAPDASAPATCTGPLSQGEFQNKLLSMSVGSAEVVWTIPADPNPGTKLLMRLLFTGMSLVAISGFVLPIPFGLMLTHYTMLKKRLRRIDVHAEGAPV